MAKTYIVEIGSYRNGTYHDEFREFSGSYETEEFTDLQMARDYFNKMKDYISNDSYVILKDNEDLYEEYNMYIEKMNKNMEV